MYDQVIMVCLVIMLITNPLVGHVILSQDHVFVYHVISKVVRCHVIKHVTGHVMVSQGHMVGE